VVQVAKLNRPSGDLPPDRIGMFLVALDLAASLRLCPLAPNTDIGLIGGDIKPLGA
jgi:hypothetical protein